MPKAIIFDFDGPLADSFRKHVGFCCRMNEKYGGPKMLPPAHNTAAWKKLAGYPITEFLTNLGFSPEKAREINDSDYAKEFGDQRDAAPLHPDMPAIIRNLKAEGNWLGIVSLNLRRNILASLGPLAGEFTVIYGCDDFPRKPPALKIALRALRSLPKDAVYIGDSLHDYQAALEVGMAFIGVSYGWQITGQESEFVSAASPAELEWMLAFAGSNAE